jgi:hypothetical protein
MKPRKASEVGTDFVYRSKTVCSFEVSGFLVAKRVLTTSAGGRIVHESGVSVPGEGP